MLNKLFTAILLSASLLAQSQVSGNQAYHYDNYAYNTANQGKPNKIFSLGDSVLIVSANILLNTQPDYYMVTFAVTEEQPTVKECSDAITKRINGFVSDLKKSGIAEKDIYVDFIAQTKVFDFDVEGRTANQVQKGFEIKKNIIIKLADNKHIDQLLVKAANYEIYDLVKADYVVEDSKKIYDQMMTAAAEVIKQRQDNNKKVTGKELAGKPRVYEENYYNVSPGNQYKNYTAFETSSVQQNNNVTYFKKEARKSSTFYYDGVSTSNFDKIIDGGGPVVGVQYVLELKVAFDLKHL